MRRSTRAGSGRTRRTGPGALLRDATGPEKALALGVAVLVLVLVGLTVAEPAALPLTGGALVLHLGALLVLRRRVLRRRRLQRRQRDRLLAAEAERGLRELERWLAGPRA